MRGMRSLIEGAVKRGETLLILDPDAQYEHAAEALAGTYASLDSDGGVSVREEPTPNERSTAE